MLKTRSANNSAHAEPAVDQLLSYLKGLGSVMDETDLSAALANLDNVRKRQADVAAQVAGLRERLDKSESDAADAIAAGRPYDERTVRAAHQALSSADSELRVLNLAVVRAEQNIPEFERNARQRVAAGLRMAHQGAVQDLNTKLEAAAAASRIVRTIEREAARLLGADEATTAGIVAASWDELLETNNGHPSRLEKWRRFVTEKAGIQI